MSDDLQASEDSASSEAKAFATSPPSAAKAGRATPALVMAGRIVLLALAGAAVAAGVLLGRARDRATAASVDRYYCPMHPQVVSPVPGDCPICNMALERMGQPEHAMSAGVDAGERVARAERRVVAEPVRAAASIGRDGLGTAVVYKDDLVGLAANEPALYYGPSEPNMGIAVHLMTGDTSPIDTSTVNVHFRLDTPRAAGSAPGPEVGSLRIAAHGRDLLLVPSSAILYSSAGPYVLAAPAGAEMFTKRMVTIGRILDSGYVGEQWGASSGAIVVLSGLAEGERVVTRDAFFVDAERRLQAARGMGEEVMP